MGLGASYSEARLLDAGAILQTELEITPSGIGQFIFVNVDFNVSILDGFKTFHGMGGVSCVTSATAACALYHASQPTLKIKTKPTDRSIEEKKVFCQ